MRNKTEQGHRIARRTVTRHEHREVRHKVTRRVFVFSVPTGETERTTVRQFVRDVEGNEHPHDTPIEIAKRREETRDWVCGVHLDLKPEMVTEAFALSVMPPGTTIISSRDVVEGHETEKVPVTITEEIAERIAIPFVLTPREKKVK